MTKLNWEKMVREIDNLVETDFCEEMAVKELPHSKPYIQKEAKQMAELLGKVYSIAHACDCGACQKDYVKK